MPEFTSTGTAYIDEFFAHHGIKGQKWGIRRYQNPDGSLTPEGLKRYGGDYDKKGRLTKKARKDDDKLQKNMKKVYELHRQSVVSGHKISKRMVEIAKSGKGSIAEDKQIDKYFNTREKQIAKRDEKLKSVVNDYISKHGTIRLADLLDSAAFNATTIGNIHNSHLNDIYDKYNRNIYANALAAEDKKMQHSGILGQKWGLRRFQNPDGTLTEAGRKRYAKKGTAKLISDKEKYRAQKAKWAKDPATLYKHKDEYTKAELDKAMEVFASQNRIKAQLEADKAARQKAKEDLKKSKIEYKKLQLQDKLNQAKAEEDYKQLKLKTEQAKLQNKQSEEAAKQKQQFANKDAQIALWKKRADKAKNVMDFAKAGKTILDDMGITSKEEGESLLGSLAVSLGIKDISAQVAKKEAKEKQEKVEGAIGFMKKIGDMYKTLNEGNKNKKFEIKFDNDKTENLTLDDILEYFQTNKFVS